MNPVSSSVGSPAAKPAAPRLRLFIARSTPNSLRAEKNLRDAMKELEFETSDLEIIDVFTQPKRAINDGVIVTPTLIGIRASGRMVIMGDLTDTAKLKLLLLG